jgi:hypothetical protein
MIKEILGTLFVIIFFVGVSFTFGSWYGTYESIVYRTETLDCVLKGAVDE